MQTGDDNPHVYITLKTRKSPETGGGAYSSHIFQEKRVFPSLLTFPETETQPDPGATVNIMLRSTKATTARGAFRTSTLVHAALVLLNGALPSRLGRVGQSSEDKAKHTPHPPRPSFSHTQAPFAATKKPADTWKPSL